MLKKTNNLPAIVMAALMLLAHGMQAGTANAQQADEPPQFDADFFDQIQADDIAFDSETGAEFIGNVEMEGELGVKCDRLNYNSVTEQVYATGIPVTLKIQDIDATCRQFDYNMKTKKMILKGDPVVYQKRPDGSTLMMKADVIEVTQTEDGKSSVNLDMEKGSRNRPIVKIIEDPKKEEEKKAKSNSSNNKPATPALIKLPQTDN